jgi:hypothetical protein
MINVRYILPCGLIFKLCSCDSPPRGYVSRDDPFQADGMAMEPFSMPGAYPSVIHDWRGRVIDIGVADQHPVPGLQSLTFEK